jgi:Ca-activated chloride channel homolog
VLARLDEVQLLNPSVLWLFVPLAAVLFVSLWKGNAPLSNIVRTIALACLIIALADPAFKRTELHTNISVLLDGSRSVSDAARLSMIQRLGSYLDQKNTTLSIIPFGRQPASSPITVSSPAELERLQNKLLRLDDLVDTGESDISAAILASLQSSSPLLLLSDGFETDGDARAAARIAAAASRPVHPIVVNESAFYGSELSLLPLYAPLVVDAGASAELRSAISNTGAQEAEGELQIFVDDKKLLSQRVRVPPGEERVITAQTAGLEGGLHRVRTVLKAGGADDTAEEIHRWISAKEREKLLLLSGTDEDRRVLKRLFAHKGYALDDIVADGSTKIPSDFKNYRGIVMNNVSRPQLPDGFLSRMKEYAERGGGVLLVGGDRSYGLGDYINTPLEEISPVKFVPPQTTKRRLNSAVILLIDKSRSMAPEGKIDGARDAALLSIRAMKDEDYIGVIGFDSAPFVIIRLSPVPEVKDVAGRRLQNLTAAGKTDLLPALAAARGMLDKTDARRKHIIVLSDGIVPAAGNIYQNELRSLAADGVTISVVALGSDADVPFMQMMSELGRGAFYHTLDARRLPEIFIHDIKVTTGEKTMKERQDYDVLRGPDGLRSSDVSGFPPLRGFVQTILRPSATSELVIRDEEKTNPLLAAWSYGKGKVVAFTSDANGRWSLPWLSWASFPKFWDDIVRSVQRSPEAQQQDTKFDLRFSVEQKSIQFDLALFDEKLLSSPQSSVSAELVAPGGEVRSVAFTPSKIGRFSASVPGRPGDYKVSISYGETKLPPVAVNISGNAFGEVPGRGLNSRLLSEIAQLSGGSINPSRKQLGNITQSEDSFERLYIPLAVTSFILVLLSALMRAWSLKDALGLLSSSNDDERGIYNKKGKPVIRRA